MRSKATALQSGSVSQGQVKHSYLALEVGRNGLEGVDVLVEVVRLLANKEQQMSLDVSAEYLLSRLLGELRDQRQAIGRHELLDRRLRHVIGQIHAALVELTNRERDNEFSRLLC